MFRKTVSLTGFLSFVLLLVTSVVLYFEPQGRVAYWADWRFLGLTKEHWDSLHIALGILFLLSGLVHVWYNWKPLTNYMRNRARDLIILTPPLVMALLVTLYFTFGALFGLPGVQQLLDFSTWLKDGHVATYGNPPYGHAELSTLDDFAKNLGLDAAKAAESLRAKGLEVAGGQTLKEIAASHDTSPQQIYAMIRAAQGGDPFEALPPSPPDGTGRMSLSEICDSYGLPLAQATERLTMNGLTVDAGLPFKELAKQNNLDAKQLYLLLRSGKRN
ncbi:MAG: DUF4405 domain-containing protein [Desulfovibrionaceae bacterium]